MVHLAPFESIEEHLNYCSLADVPREEASFGFKIFSDEEKLGLCQIKFVGEAAYILALKGIESKISVEMLANVFTSVIEFLQRIGVASLIYPIQSEDDVVICEATGFDRISETLYAFDFPTEENEEE